MIEYDMNDPELKSEILTAIRGIRETAAEVFDLLRAINKKENNPEKLKKALRDKRELLKNRLEYFLYAEEIITGTDGIDYQKPFFDPSLPYELALFINFCFQENTDVSTLGRVIKIERFFNQLKDSMTLSKEKLSKLQEELDSISRLLDFCKNCVKTGQVKDYEKHYQCLVLKVPNFIAKVLKWDPRAEEVHKTISQKSLLLYKSWTMRAEKELRQEAVMRPAACQPQYENLATSSSSTQTSSANSQEFEKVSGDEFEIVLEGWPGQDADLRKTSSPKPWD